jgi:hypothetical protein
MIGEQISNGWPVAGFDEHARSQSVLGNCPQPPMQGKSDSLGRDRDNRFE